MTQDERVTSAPTASPTLSPVAAMFNERSVFITGASGFIGRVLLEKLLRTYSGIKNVYILMRVKKNMAPSERLHKQLLKVPIFDRIREMDNGRELLDKIIVVPGDIAEPNLGISEEFMQILTQDESLGIVFHSAATIKFDEPLKVSVQLNLIATKTIIELCRRLPRLVSLCHVSTAYVNSDMKQNQSIGERMYPMREEPEQLIQLAQIMDEGLMQTLKMKLVDQRPNTYTYTKALAEHLIALEAADLPVAIVRPSIVVASWREPVRGWIDNLNGPTGLILAIGKGLLRSMHVSRHVKADIIPVDVVVNAMIASAYYATLNHRQRAGALETNNNNVQHQVVAVKRPLATVNSNEAASGLLPEGVTNGDATTKSNGVASQRIAAKADRATAKTEPPNEEKPRKAHESDIPIIQCNSGELRPITWGQMEDMFFPIIRHYPSCQVLRYPFGSFKSNRYHDFLTRLFVHYLPALLIDLLCIASGKKNIIGKIQSNWQLLSVYNKLHSATAALAHFCTTNYNFESKELRKLRSVLDERDRQELYMDIENLDWYKFWDDYVLGARRYVLKEPDETLPQARQNFKRAYWIEMGFRCLLVLILCYLSLPLMAKLIVAAMQNNQLRQVVGGASRLTRIVS